MQEFIENIKTKFSISETYENREGQIFLKVPADNVIMLITRLRDKYGFSHLAFMTVVDRLEDGYFELVYMLHNYEGNIDLAVKVELPRENAEMESIHHLWPTAWSYQRELHEMFGVNFPGSPRVDESFILEGWEDIPPMRRDFDSLEYSDRTYFPRPGRFTVEPREQMREKIYPEELGDSDE